jgi:4-carboxymuconolactone decarboxylase
MFSPGFYITAELRVKDSAKTAEAKNALNLLCIATRKELGCYFFVMHQDLITPTRLILWERFDNESALILHFEQLHTTTYLALDLTKVVSVFKTSTI